MGSPTTDWRKAVQYADGKVADNDLIPWPCKMHFNYAHAASSAL